MKLAVFGATGSIGQQIVTMALQKGHEVTAFTRSPDKISNSHQNLHLLKGDVTDDVSVQNAIKNQDAVLCALGMPLTNNDNLRAKGTKTIIEAMKKTNVKRLVCLSIFGAHDSYAQLPLSYKLIIFPLILRRALKDHELQEMHIKNTDLNWVIVRPTNFSDVPFQTPYWHGLDPGDKKLKLKISRAELADFMLKQVSDDTYLHKTPGISH